MSSGHFLKDFSKDEWYQLDDELKGFIRALRNGQSPLALLWDQMVQVKTPKKPETLTDWARRTG